MIRIFKIRQLLTLLPRTMRYLFDRRVPFYYKFLPFLVVPFSLTPVALMTDLVPVLGLLDEFTVTAFSLALFTKLSEKVLAKYPAEEVARPLNVVDGEYRVIEQAATPATAKEHRQSKAQVR